MAYRGVARTGVCFAIELLMDAVAREVGREPWEVRMDNLVPAASMPMSMSPTSTLTAETIRESSARLGTGGLWGRA